VVVVVEPGVVVVVVEPGAVVLVVGAGAVVVGSGAGWATGCAVGAGGGGEAGTQPARASASAPSTTAPEVRQSGRRDITPRCFGSSGHGE